MPSGTTSLSGWQLVVSGQHFPLGDCTTLGREQGNDICLQDEQISRCHAVVERVETGFQIADLKSSNGTFVNGKRIQEPVMLRPGDTIQLGSIEVNVSGGVKTAERICSNCGESGKPGREFCTRCGNPLPTEGRIQ